jgi:hypothetical protein
VLYDVSGSSLLSDEAKVMASSDPAAFADENELVEALLELDTDPLYVDDPDPAKPQLETKITRAVVLQVNYQIELGIEGFAGMSADPSEIRRTFRSVRGEQPPYHPQAIIIRDQVRVQYAAMQPGEDEFSGWTTVRGVR